MFPLSLHQLPAILPEAVQLTGVDLQSTSARMDRQIQGASLDSRRLADSELFFAVSGSQVHGIQFLKQAIQAGAAAVISDVRPDTDLLAEATAQHIPVWLVPDAVSSLQKLAVWNRRQFNGTMIGVTGSVGKTTTRQMIACVLNHRFQVTQSPANYNNELGVPLALLQINSSHQSAVLELGACRSGDIQLLTRLTSPRIAVITRVAAAHLDSFGNLDQIGRTKQELAESIPADGTVILNADDDRVAAMRHVTQAEVLLAGRSAEADFRADEITAVDGRLCFRVRELPFQIQGGAHLLVPALQAVAVGMTLGVSLADCAEQLSSFRPDTGRGLVIQREPFLLIDETYNASPASMNAAVAMLKSWKTSGRRILVLGDMLELGNQACNFHQQLGAVIAESGVECVLVTGQFACDVEHGMRNTSAQNNAPQRNGPMVEICEDARSLLQRLQQLVQPQDIVLVKASRGMQLESVVHGLAQHAVRSHS